MNEMEKLPDKPPLFKSWRTWYALVIGFLVLLILLFVLFTEKFQ